MRLIFEASGAGKHLVLKVSTTTLKGYIDMGHQCDTSEDSMTAAHAVATDYPCHRLGDGKLKNTDGLQSGGNNLITFKILRF